ncbi:Universal stress protein family protein [Shimia gijangensis]|uniref:Universal stress protein family protein n=1 Tax=Shimia gijangensis TaxID=1470563 RepID=A0A1M6CM32_9RHOB|nr:universal stress protein [Shimia gijangensis]SHI61834.1 Universal stress protein family protein [Shimia gijangensis]
MDTILVATDLSERSDRAIERALRIASEQKAKCHVVSVVDDALPVEISNNLADSISERLLSLLDGKAPDADTEVTVLRGETIEMLTRFASLHEADLMVLGLHRPRIFLDGLRETTMERLVASSMVPVLLVTDAPDAPYRNVLIPISFSPACAAAIHTVKQLAPVADVTAFHALHVPFAGLTGGADDTDMARAATQDASKMRDQWMAAVTLPEGTPKPKIVTGSVRFMMEEKLSELKPDLLAIGAHTRSGFAIRRLGGFAAELVRQPPVDLLISPLPRL